MRKAETTFVAVDVGRAYTKVICGALSLRVPTAVSLLAPAKEHTTHSSGGHPNRYIFSSGVPYYVDDGSERLIDTRSERFLFSEAQLAVVADTIRRLGYLDFLHGPLHMFMSATRSDSGRFSPPIPRIENIPSWRLLTDGEIYPYKRFRELTVMSRRDAAWYDFVLDDHGRIREELVLGCTAIVDIGHWSTDVAIYDNGFLRTSVSSELNSGMSSVMAAIRVLTGEANRRIHFDYVVAPFPDEELIQRGSLIQAAQPISAHEMIEMKSLVQEIVFHVDGCLSAIRATPKPRIVFVGGGAAALRASLQGHFPEALFPSAPEMSVARGMHKSALNEAATSPWCVESHLQDCSSVG